MRENRTCGSEGGEAQTNEPSLPLSMKENRSRHCPSLLALPLRRSLVRRCYEIRFLV